LKIGTLAACPDLWSVLIDGWVQGVTPTPKAVQSKFDKTELMVFSE